MHVRICTSVYTSSIVGRGCRGCHVSSHRSDGHAEHDGDGWPRRWFGPAACPEGSGSGSLLALGSRPVPVPPFVARTGLAGLTEEAICTAPLGALTSLAPSRWCGCIMVRCRIHVGLLVKTVGGCVRRQLDLGGWCAAACNGVPAWCKPTPSDSGSAWSGCLKSPRD
jgi:hypothetical protein